MAELLISFRRFAWRLLPLACLLLLPDFCLAQAATNYCEASPAVKEEFRKLAEVDDADLPYRSRRERQLAMLEALLKKYPNDFHVQRRYQVVRLSGFFVDREALIAEYRAQMEQHPNDPEAMYLYARMLVGRQTKEAIALLTKLAQERPEFPWTYSQLAEIYTYPNFRDPAKSQEQLKQLRAKCPAGTNGLALISRSGDKELMTAAAQTLRPRLESSTNTDDLAYWETLWTLEFKLIPVTEHAELRKKIADDLKRIRESIRPAKNSFRRCAKVTNRSATKQRNVRWKTNWSGCYPNLKLHAVSFSRATSKNTSIRKRLKHSRRITRHSHKRLPNG